MYRVVYNKPLPMTAKGGKWNQVVAKMKKKGASVKVNKKTEAYALMGTMKKAKMKSFWASEGKKFRVWRVR